MQTHATLGRTVGLRSAVWLPILFFFAVSSAAQTLPQHDLRLVSIDVPSVVHCSVDLGATVLVNGDLDHLETGNGDAGISFYWARVQQDVPPPDPQLDEGWTQINEDPLLVGWTSDEPFTPLGALWPDDFGSVPHPTYRWHYPAGVGSFHIRAKVDYRNGTVDNSPRENVLVVSGIRNATQRICDGSSWWSCSYYICSYQTDLFFFNSNLDPNYLFNPNRDDLFEGDPQ